MRTWWRCGVLVVLLAGCGGSGSPTPSTTKPARASPAAGQVEKADAARILQAVRSPGASAVVVNVWATWCTPCREEFPDLVRLYREYGPRGLRLLLVSADFEDQMPEVRGFLGKHGVDFHSFMKTGKDMEFINQMDSRWSGALPATFVYDREGQLRSFHEGKTTFAALESLVVAASSARAPGKETVR